ncbi:laminin subunit alpha-3 [Aphelenchoides avenae]|nr:laminin subunit alpha-3 [Aphelenchus avenae]
MRLTRMDATRAPAANATATQGILQNVARFDGAQAAPGPSILKKATKLTVIVGKDVEDDCSTNVLSTPKRRPEALPTEKQLGVRLKPGPSNDDLRAQLAESKAQIEELKQQMELLDARHASERASEQRTAEQNLNCIVDQVQEQSRKQEKELIEQLSAKDTEIAGLNAKLKQQSVQWQTIYERNNGLEKANADLLAEVTELRRQNEDQSQKLASMAEDAEEAQETLKQMSDQLFARNDELGEKVSSLEAKCASFESDLCESKAEKDTLKETTEKLELERASVLRDELQREVAIAARLDDVAKS